MTRAREAALTIALVVGEESGDQLGAALMDALRGRLGTDGVRFIGVGGSRMQQRGITSLFSLEDIAVMGITAVIGRLRLIVRRIRQTATAIIEAEPDALVIIDSPDFTHRVARRVRKARPSIPIIDYVSPSVWVWRPGRARAMTGYVDRVLAILPFEPEVHRRLGGPPCDYVGHPLIERRDALRGSSAERAPLADAERPVLMVLPGSRRGEIERMMPCFEAAVGEIVARSDKPLELILPTVPHLKNLVDDKLRTWPVQPLVVAAEEEKFAAFRRAHAALATSGTVALELALAGVPTVIAYRLDAVYRQLNRLRRLFPKMVQVDTMVLPNIILKEKIVPEFLEDEAAPERLATTVLALLHDGSERQRQLAAFARLDDAMRLDDGVLPSARAAEIVLEVIATRPR